MLKLSEELKNSGFDARIVLQVHDEILLEVVEKESQDVLKIVKEIMQNAVKLKVPLICKAKIAKTWYDAKN